MPAAIRGHKLALVKLTIVFIYGVLLLISFLIAASVWHWQMAGVYYVSHKPMLADFVPPFIHTGAEGNFYMEPVRMIYMIWFVYMVMMFLLPAGFTWLLMRLRQNALNKVWQ